MVEGCLNFRPLGGAADMRVYRSDLLYRCTDDGLASLAALGCAPSWTCGPGPNSPPPALPALPAARWCMHRSARMRAPARWRSRAPGAASRREERAAIPPEARRPGPATMLEFLRIVRERWGSVQACLLHLGVPAGVLRRAADALRPATTGTD